MRKTIPGGLRHAPVFACAVLSLTAAAPGQAQDQPRSDPVWLEEIVVTATKRSESLQDVPLAVSAISAEDIELRGLTQYADYLNSIPGVHFQDAGPGQSQIRMRGIVASEGGGGSASVATYFGETITSVMSLFGSKPNLRLVDIDQVEVLRGPQGTLFGANALSGVVRIVPAAADLSELELDVGARGFTTAHSDDASYHLEGVMNIPLIEDRLALRLVGYQDDIAGYVDNVVPAQDDLEWTQEGEQLLALLTGQAIDLPDGTLVIPGNPAFTREDINSEDTWGVRASLAWQATDRLRVDLTHAVQDVTLDSQPFVEPRGGRYAQQRSLDQFAPAEYGERLDLSTLVASYDWDAVSLVSATNLARLEGVFRDDATLFAAPTFGGIPVPLEDRTDTEGEVFTQEIRVQSRGDGPLQWLAGVFYLDQEVDVRQTLVDHSCPSCLPTALFGDDFMFRYAPPGTDPRFVNQTQRSVFGEVSYRFAPQWTVGIGGRYLEEDMERLTAPVEGFLVGGSLPAEPPAGGEIDEVNPSGYLRFRPNDDMMLYAQAARGFRSAQTNSLLAYTGMCENEAAAIGLGPVVDPDTLWNYELGMKSQLAEGRFSVNGALYRQEWEGVQLPVQMSCGFGGTVNGGDVEGHGVEVEVAAHLGEAWRFDLAAAYIDNEFDSVQPNTGFEVGERPPGAPDRNASAGLQYDFSINNRWTGYSRVDYRYVGSVRYKFGQVNPLVVTQDAYDLTDVRIGFRRENLSLELFGRNITDERAVVNRTDPALGNRRYLSRPREVGVEARYSFR